MKKISVIVPVYNKEDYLVECLDSICSQTMPPEDIEVICVDDQSTDSSLEILKEYEKNNSNFTVIRRETNSGTPGIPRNEALEKATGEYVFFVDPDDYLGLEALERMYNYARENNSDVVLCKYTSVGGRGVPRSMFKKTEANVDLADSRIIYTLSPQKLFRLSLIKDNNIKFPTYMRSGSDQPFVMRAYLESKVISVLTDYDYYYLVKHAGEHMSVAHTHPENFYRGMGEVLRSIGESSLSSERKEKAMAIFLNRHFDFERTNHFTIKYEKDKEEWMFHIREMVVNNIPENVDDLVQPHVKIKLRLIRENDLENLSLFNLQEKEQSYQTRIVDGELIRHSPYLDDYNFTAQDLNVSYRDRLTHSISNLNLEDNCVVIEGDIKHTLLDSEHNNKQQLSGVLVNRTTKKERFYQSESGEGCHFKFKIDFHKFTDQKEDLGIWDFFIDSEVEGYKKRARIGKRSQALKLEVDLYFLDKLNYKVHPYFTRPPYDNLSFKLEELAIISRKNLNQLYEDMDKQERLIKKQDEFINGIIDSRSWKLTRIFRKIGDYKRKLK